eukprot:1195492-Prorocentrum_minimum.AAC.2
MGGALHDLSLLNPPSSLEGPQTPRHRPPPLDPCPSTNSSREDPSERRFDIYTRVGLQYIL